MEPELPPLVLAPLLGVTTAAFRRVHRRLFGGFDRDMAPFLSTTKGKQPPRSYFKDIWPENNPGAALVPQLLGKDGVDFREMANRISEEFGYAEVNWNIGCPAATVTSRQRGAGLLPHPEQIAAFLAQATAGLRPRLSVKMRLGMERPDECLALVDILNSFDIKEITIHGRTGRQQYAGRADPEGFAALAERLAAPVAYNGDIDSPAQAWALAARFPRLSSIMIGRGAVRRPDLAAACRAAPAEPGDAGRTPLAALKRFHDELYAEYRAAMSGGPGPLLGKMKEVWTYWPANLGERPVRQVLKSKSLAEYEDRAAHAFDSPDYSDLADSSAEAAGASESAAAGSSSSVAP